MQSCVGRGQSPDQDRRKVQYNGRQHRSVQHHILRHSDRRRARTYFDHSVHPLRNHRHRNNQAVVDTPLVEWNRIDRLHTLHPRDTLRIRGRETHTGEAIWTVLIPTTFNIINALLIQGITDLPLWAIIIALTASGIAHCPAMQLVRGGQSALARH